MGAGFGEAEVDDEIAFSGEMGAGFRADTATGGCTLRVSDGVPVDPRGGRVRGDVPSAGSTRDGEAESGGALNGWNDIDGRRGIGAPLSRARAAARPVGPIRAAGERFLEGEEEGDSDEGPESRAARRVEMGLGLVVGPT